MSRASPGFAFVPALGLAFVLLISTTASVQYLGTFLAAPAQPPARADLIVSLGGDAGDRAERAAELYADGYAPRILLTGAALREHDARVYRLQRAGVPRASIQIDNTAANSWQEAHLVRRLMDANGWRRVLVVSDPPHLRRLQWSLQQAFGESALEYRLVSSKPAWWDAARWWTTERARRFAARELVKLTYYHLRYRW